MDVEVTATTAAAPDRVWATLVDVESWPKWTASMTSVKRLDEGELRLGSRARIRQPGLPPAVWKVTDLVPGEGFSWAATGPGIRTIGHHRFAPTPDGTITLTLAVEQTGPLAGVMQALLAGKTRRFLRLEVDGWKAASEAAAGAA